MFTIKKEQERLKSMEKYFLYWELELPGKVRARVLVIYRPPVELLSLLEHKELFNTAVLLK